MPRGCAARGPCASRPGASPSTPPRRIAHDGLLLTGDAAGVATPWACMGCETALVTGRMTGVTALRAFARGDYSLRALRSYQDEWDAAHGEAYRQARLLARPSWGQTEASWARQVERFGRLDPAERLASLGIDRRPFPRAAVALMVNYDRLGRLRRAVAAHLHRKATA